ncbi:heterokaryon incompatibility protein-domain-containing protein [Ganoderma leucocontextum]|nr:heterokaryon incompatibility protein-domain-containing protein [Ganoderma leucocontextum]
MWLLSTDRAELRYFSRNFDVEGGYAILSHTWEGDEQTFQDVEAIGERCRRDGTNPRDFIHPKVRNCCILTEKQGHRWVWIDSCCIDKTSSSELSEGINSMYQWYQEAEVCYAYLVDVPGDCVLSEPNSAFRKSRWHMHARMDAARAHRPRLRHLPLENKAALAKLLQEITRVDSRVLTWDLKSAHWSISVRMSWASSRKTTRVEDEVYCLMGLFGVSMLMNYGEGKRAFICLQYEIMQHDSDMSLFTFRYYLFVDFATYEKMS